MKIRTALMILVLAIFGSFASFALQFTPAAQADGLVVVNCPPIVVPLSPVPLVTPLPFQRPPVEFDPPQTPAVPPNIATGVARPPIVPPVRRDCATYLSVKNHNVTVTIENQVARTHVDETFLNDSAYQLEGTYIFPLPDDATISDFAMWVDGKKLEGKVLDKNQARQIYEDIVRTKRDPALLEYIGRNAFQARIFPIPPQSEKRVEIEYAQVLQIDQGLVRYVYPLNTEKFSAKPLANVSVNVTLKSTAALKAIYSPSHNVSVARTGEYAAQIGYEERNVKPDRDFVLYYSVTPDDIGLNLLSYRAGNDDGFFLMLVAPKVQVNTAQVIAKDVILVLDTSGSMQGAKIAQAKNALTYILDQLNPSDRFNIISFSTGTNAFARGLQPASARNDARNFVTRIQAEGSTDINRALLEALGNADKERPTIVIFLTDGLPTMGETNPQKIIANVTSAAPKNVRLFPFGVGDDVNTILLDTLAEKLRGASAYVRPAEKIDEVVSAFYAKVSTPVLSDMTVDWGGVTVSEVYPYPLPDLFAGSQLVIAGRYRGGAPTTITLKGNVNGVPQTYRYADVAFKSSGGDDFIPRLWATRKIGYLLNAIRLRGEAKETVNEIVALAVRYGIVTPYTSFLVDERSNVLTDQGRTDAAKQAQATMAPAAMPNTGAAAVQQSQDQNQMRGAGVAPVMPTSAPKPASPGSSAPAEVITPIQVIADKTFLLRNGVWLDTQYDPSKMTPTKIEFGSDAYFALGANNPAWGKYLALGSRVIVVINNVAYEITDSGMGATAPSQVVIPTLGIPTPESRVVPLAPTIPGAPTAAATTRDSSALTLCGGTVVGMLAVGWMLALLALRGK